MRGDAWGSAGGAATAEYGTVRQTVLQQQQHHHGHPYRYLLARSTAEYGQVRQQAEHSCYTA